MKYILLISVLLIGGCYSTGKKIDTEAVNQFVKNETTMSEVKVALGEPQSTTTTSDGKTILVYLYTDTDVKASTYIPIIGAFTGGASTKMQTVTLTFTAEILEEWTSSDTNSDFNY